MIARTSKRAHRLSVWTLILTILLLSVAAALPAHAAPILDKAEEGAQKAGEAAGDMARDATDGIGDMVRGATDGDGDGAVQDGDGKIGNEENAEDDGMSKWGQVALLVVIAAVIIAIIILVVMVPKRKKQ